MKAFKPILQNPANYIESAGKHDAPHLLQALERAGENTALRVCLWRNTLQYPYALPRLCS
jgi:hypothetical protein